MDASNVVNGVPLEYVTLHAINYSLKEAVGLKSVTKSVYVTKLESTFQLFVSIMDASNVLNGAALEYVTLHAINYSLKNLRFEKCHAKGICN